MVRFRRSSPSALTIRPFELADAAATYAVFYAAVHQSTSAHYSEAQREAWVASPEPSDAWRDRLADHITYVALRDEQTLGFASLNHSGYFDLLYTAPTAQREGVATLLYVATLNDPRATTPLLETEASYLSRPFFAHHGWQDHGPQTIMRRGVSLTNFKMSRAHPYL
ncbi:MAG: GNAT family N-acetyltransferase [Pseudomonadota bacterium]